MATYNIIMSGYNAYKRGVKFTDCPHKEGSKDWLHWTCGWIKAKESDK